MSNFHWLIELRQLWCLLFGCVFLIPMLRVPSYKPGNMVTCPPNGMIYLWLVAVVLAIALTPEETMGGDKINYTNTFYAISSGRSVWNEFDKDVLFYGWVHINALFTKNPTFFFILTAFVYVGGYINGFKRINRDHWCVLVVAAVFGLGFFAYGDNTLRAGMAYSLLLIGISLFYQKKVFSIVFAVIAILVHHSMVIPVSALAIAYFYKNTKIIFFGWLVLLGVALVFGNATQEFLAQFFENWEDQRMASYALGSSDVYRQGFRWDFLIYGFVPIALGLYYRYRKHFEDPFYVWILNSYIIANGFWLLMIRAPFTDRFAYLSWALMPIVLFYPLLKRRIWGNQNLCIVGGLILILLINLSLAFRNLFWG